MNKKYKNKSNLEIVSNYLEGTRPFVVVGYTPSPKERKDGDEWTDNKGLKWIQRNGYKTRVNEQANIIRKALNRKCSCGQEIQFGSKLDDKFFIKTGKCFDCVIKEETELRILGVFSYYEIYKMLSNYMGFLEDMRQKIEDSIKYFQTDTGTFEMVCNSAGFIEKFKGMNPSELLESAKKDLSEITISIEKVKKDTLIAKKTYDMELKKAKKRLAPKNQKS